MWYYIKFNMTYPIRVRWAHFLKLLLNWNLSWIITDYILIKTYLRNNWVTCRLKLNCINQIKSSNGNELTGKMLLTSLFFASALFDQPVDAGFDAECAADFSPQYLYSGGGTPAWVGQVHYWNSLFRHFHSFSEVGRHSCFYRTIPTFLVNCLFDLIHREQFGIFMCEKHFWHHKGCS